MTFFSLQAHQAVALSEPCADQPRTAPQILHVDVVALQPPTPSGWRCRLCLGRKRTSLETLPLMHVCRSCMLWCVYMEEHTCKWGVHAPGFPPSFQNAWPMEAYLFDITASFSSTDTQASTMHTAPSRTSKSPALMLVPHHLMLVDAKAH